MKTFWELKMVLSHLENAFIMFSNYFKKVTFIQCFETILKTALKWFENVFKMVLKWLGKTIFKHIANSA
jgi:hypothetical protein